MVASSVWAAVEQAFLSFHGEWAATPAKRAATHPVIGQTDRRSRSVQVQLDAPIVWPTESKVELAFWPNVVIAAMQTTIMRANITAYSTAVGPSSRFRKFTTLFNMGK